MKHLRIFNSMEEFKAAKPSMNTRFVVLEKGTKKVIYSNLKEITEDDIISYDYVDLGLPSGLKWATCNVGATSPCEYGLLYQFGRVDGYAYGDTNHQFRTASQNEADTGDPYTPATTSGKTYNAGDVLDPADDAAYVASSGTMRMPTYIEYQELILNTTNEWVSCRVMDGEHISHNVLGRLFTSKNDSSKKLFFPAAGFYDESYGYFSNAGTNGDYWSSSIYDNNVNRSVSVYFNLGGCNLNASKRYYGSSIRGVFNN